MVDINVTRINNFEYSFKLSSREGIRHVAKALTFRNPDPFAYSHKIEKFDKRRLTFRINIRAYRQVRRAANYGETCRAIR